jgi:hypothetical protein
MQAWKLVPIASAFCRVTWVWVSASDVWTTPSSKLLSGDVGFRLPGVRTNLSFRKNLHK